MNLRYQTFLVEQEKQLLEDKDKLLRLLGTIMMFKEKDVLDKLDEIAVKLSILRDEMKEWNQ